MDCLRTQFHAGRLLNGRYETVAPLNHGSFGMVVMAKDMQTGKDVAIKCLAKSAGDTGLKVDERSEELKIHSQIPQHPNIVNLLDSFETASHVYIVLEYCAVGDLYEAIRLQKGPRETGHVRDFMLQLLDAVQHLHANGVSHRDIKPENIFLTAAGDLKLGDFGLATTETWSYETAVGSDRYMAPEQFDHSGNGLDPARGDLWSIGICLLNILFSRNPFGVPSHEDPLFVDYVADRQSLFDVFPNMSQDTFQVLTHCLAIIPEKRDMSLLRDAFKSVVSFTTDDESLDDFCTDNREAFPVTANRQPLRTPSVTSPGEPNEAFPWSKALLASPRKLSAIADVESISEDLFPASDVSTHDWADKADAQSFQSTVDSNGMSLGSSVRDLPRTRPVAIGSLPSRATSRIASFFGRKKPFESKSWSDLYEEDEDEDEYEQHQDQALASFEPGRPTSRPGILSRRSKLSMLSRDEDSDSGRSTPRPIPRATAAAPTQPASAKDDNVSQQTGFVFDDDHALPAALPAAKYSPPTRRSLTDKWAALGEMRKRAGNSPPSTPAPFADAADAAIAKDATPRQMQAVDDEEEDTPRSRFRPHLRYKFSRTTNPNRRVDHSVWQQKEWNISTDWRRTDAVGPATKSPLGLGGSSTSFHYPASRVAQLDGTADDDADGSQSEDDFLFGDFGRLRV